MSDTNTVAPEQPQYSKLRVGLMLGAVIMLLLIKGFGNYKFVPMQTLIMEFYNVGESAYGYLNTASGWVTTICVIPFAFIVRKIRCNWSIIIGMGVAAAGIFVQSVAGSFAMLVIGRVVEGTGTGFANLVTAALILNLVDRRHVAFWSSMMTMVGVLPQIIMAKGGTALIYNSGMHFQTLFRIIVFIYIGAIALWLVLVPFSLRITGVGSSQKPTREQTIRVIKNKSNWLVALANWFFTMAACDHVLLYRCRRVGAPGIDPSKPYLDLHHLLGDPPTIHRTDGAGFCNGCGRTSGRYSYCQLCEECHQSCRNDPSGNPDWLFDPVSGIYGYDLLHGRRHGYRRNMLDLCKTDSLRLPGYFLILEKNYPFSDKRHTISLHFFRIRNE